MLDGSLTVRINKEDLKNAKEWCDKNITSISLQVQALIKELANRQNFKFHNYTEEELKILYKSTRKEIIVDNIK